MGDRIMVFRAAERILARRDFHHLTPVTRRLEYAAILVLLCYKVERTHYVV